MDKNEIPLATRELLKELRTLVMPQSLQEQVAILENGTDETRNQYLGEIRLVTTLIERFEKDHGPL